MTTTTRPNWISEADWAALVNSAHTLVQAHWEGPQAVDRYYPVFSNHCHAVADWRPTGDLMDLVWAEARAQLVGQ